MSDWDDWEDHNAAVVAEIEQDRLDHERDELAISQHLAELEADEVTDHA